MLLPDKIFLGLVSRMASAYAMKLHEQQGAMVCGSNGAQKLQDVKQASRDCAGLALAQRPWGTWLMASRIKPLTPVWQHIHA